MNRLPKTLALALLALLGQVATLARAELVISADKVSLAPGGTGTMRFDISSTTGTDTLADFSLQLLITPIGTPAADLQFSPTQPDPYGDSTYVFFGRSFGQDQDPAIPFWSLPPGFTNYNADTISGGDAEFTPSDGLGFVTIPTAAGGGPLLLATVQFFVPTGALPMDQYQVSLVPDGTVFDDQQGDPYPTYMSTPGTVTIASVPEPSTAVTGLTGAVLGSVYVTFRRRRSRRR